VDLVETALEPGDRLLFCSDGLFKAVKEPMIQRMVTAQPDNAKACAELVAAANAAGGPDNITVVIGTVGKKTFKENLKDLFRK
jgi:protein phosphatase